jgi:hypothetical protein
MVCPNSAVLNIRSTRLVRLFDVFPGPRALMHAVDWRGVISATAEVILSAGVVQTPHLLMLSGIGDKSTLAAFGIDTIINNPNVGQHVQEHPILYNHWAVVNTAYTVDAPKQNATVLAEEIEVWKANGTGPLTISAPNHIAWARIPTDVAPFSTLDDPAPGSNTGHLEFVFLVSFF